MIYRYRTHFEVLEDIFQGRASSRQRQNAFRELQVLDRYKCVGAAIGLNDRRQAIAKSYTFSGWATVIPALPSPRASQVISDRICHLVQPLDSMRFNFDE